ncbi:MAG: hypothetical protein AB9866_08535 [Syntrophobacteraceae bacterium]
MDGFLRFGFDLLTDVLLFCGVNLVAAGVLTEEEPEGFLERYCRSEEPIWA